jgi:hypothetical protein
MSDSTAVADVSGGEGGEVGLMLSWSDVGMVEGRVAAESDGGGVGLRGKSSRVSSMGMSTGFALVDSREIGRGTKELGLTGQVSNAVERD